MVENSLQRSVSTPAVLEIVVEHAYRGQRLQLAMRAALLIFVLATLVVIPPRPRQLECYLIAGAYIVWTVAVAVWVLRGGPRTLRLGWLALFVDIAVLCTLSLVAGVGEDSTWTAFVLTNGLFLVPVMSATQLRPYICAAVVGPTVLAYAGTTIAARHGNGEPWSSLVLRTAVVLAVGICCILLSRIQRSRVATIGELVGSRSELLSELLTVEDRERRAVAEDLHDGALQHVLAARLDLEDARERADPAAFDRVERALVESSKLLRSTVSQLHPSVLEHAGLAQALRELADTARARGGFALSLHTDGWPDGLRTNADPVLFATARELLANVVKHAQADSVDICLERNGGRVRLSVADDGRGLPASGPWNGVTAGHIGLESHRVRIEGVGGSLMVEPAEPRGTRAVVELPLVATGSSTADQPN